MVEETGWNVVKKEDRSHVIEGYKLTVPIENIHVAEYYQGSPSTPYIQSLSPERSVVTGKPLSEIPSYGVAFYKVSLEDLKKMSRKTMYGVPDATDKVRELIGADAISLEAAEEEFEKNVGNSTPRQDSGWFCEITQSFKKHVLPDVMARGLDSGQKREIKVEPVSAVSGFNPLGGASKPLLAAQQESEADKSGRSVTSTIPDKKEGNNEERERSQLAQLKSQALKDAAKAKEAESRNKSSSNTSLENSRRGRSSSLGDRQERDRSRDYRDSRSSKDDRGRDSSRDYRDSRSSKDDRGRDSSRDYRDNNKDGKKPR